MYGVSGKSTILDNDFLLYYLLSDRFLAQTAIHSDRVAMPKLNQETLAELSIWLPDVSKQSKISEKLSHNGK